MTDKQYLITEAQRDIVNAAIRMGELVIENGKDEEYAAFDAGFKVLQSLPMVDSEPVAYRLPEPDVDKKHHYFDLDEVEPVAHLLESLYTSPQALIKD